MGNSFVSLCLVIEFKHVLCRLEKIPSQNAYRDLKTWWNMCAKAQKFWGTGPPHLPSVQEVKQTKEHTLAAEGIIVYKREVTSARAVCSSLQINTEWYPRDCTCLLSLRFRAADTCAELVAKLEKIATSGNKSFVCKLMFQF